MSDKNQLLQALNAFANYSMKSGTFDYEYEDKPFQNLYSALYKIKEIQEIFDLDILMYGVQKAITKRFQKLPIKLEEGNIEEILQEIIVTLKNNLAEHLIVVPIQSAQFDKIIKFDNLIFIPQNYSRKEKLKIISRASKKTISETEWIVGHTEKSRSEDFLKYPLLVIKQNQQTSTVHYNALNVAKIIIYSIRCFYYGNIYKTNKDKKHLIFWSQSSLSEASHLAIYAKENWRQNHKPLNFDVSVPFDLKWLEDKKTVKEFKGFLKSIYTEGNLDDFNVTFLNGLILYNESIKQNTSISTIITMTIAESILTRNKNEKRLRISAILPRLLKFKKNERKRISKLFDELYQKRNNFVHSGESVSIDYDFESNEPTILEKGRIIIAKLILDYPKFEKIVNKEISTTNQTTRMKYWESYVDSIFREIIY